jgi:hypothetical protein
MAEAATSVPGGHILVATLMVLKLPSLHRIIPLCRSSADRGVDQDAHMWDVDALSAAAIWLAPSSASASTCRRAFAADVLQMQQRAIVDTRFGCS